MPCKLLKSSRLLALVVFAAQSTTSSMRGKISVNSSIYKEAAQSGFQTVNAEDWENERLFKWQERKIVDLAMERRIKFGKLKELVRGWVGKELVGQLSRKEGMLVIRELKNFNKLVELGEKKVFEQREVGKVKVREF